MYLGLSHSLEESILQRAKEKRVLEHLVIQTLGEKEGKSDGNNLFNRDDLAAILKFGAKDLFEEVFSLSSRFLIIG